MKLHDPPHELFIGLKQNTCTCHKLKYVFFHSIGKPPTYQTTNSVEKVNQNMPTAGTGGHVSIMCSYWNQFSKYEHLEVVAAKCSFKRTMNVHRYL